MGKRALFGSRDMVPVIDGRVAKLARIYVSGSQDGPVRIGFRNDSALNNYRIIPHVLYQAWTVDISIARKLHSSVCHLLDKADKRVGTGNTFNVPLVWAVKVICFVAQEKKIPLFTDPPLVSKDEFITGRMIKESGIFFSGGRNQGQL